MSPLFLIFAFSVFVSPHNFVAQKMAIYHADHPILQNFRNQGEQYKLEGAVNDFHSIYVTVLKIGSETVYLVFDTGSHFIWVQHIGCKYCLPQQPPIITNFSASSATSPMRCNLTGLGNDCQYRTSTPGSDCKSTICTYQVKYRDGSGSGGVVVSDIITPFIDQTVSQKMVFGVGFLNRCNPLYSCFQGVAGFGAGPLALPSQLVPTPSRWGFCLPSDPSMNGTFLVGSEAQIVDRFSRGRIYDSEYFYIANLTDVYVGTDKLTFYKENAMILIDTGASYTFLDDPIFDNLVYAVRNQVKVLYDMEPLISPVPGTLELCYDRPYEVRVTLQLQEVNFYLYDPLQVWYNASDEKSQAYCLSFVRNGGAYYNVIGSYHLRGQVIIYDLTDPNAPFVEVSFTNDNC